MESVDTIQSENSKSTLIFNATSISTNSSKLTWKCDKCNIRGCCRELKEEEDLRKASHQPHQLPTTTTK